MTLGGWGEGGRARECAWCRASKYVYGEEGRYETRRRGMRRGYERSRDGEEERYVTRGGERERERERKKGSE